MVRAAWAWTRVLGGVGILAFVLWRLGTGALLDSLHLLTCWTLAAALGIGVMTTVFSAWRWCLVARGLGIDLPLRTAIADYYRALFVNAALPSGILGDVHRAVRNGKDSGDVGRGVRAVVLERFAGQVVLVTFGVTVLLSHPALARHVNLPRALVAIVGAALVLGGIVLWVRRRTGASRIGRGLRTGLRTGIADVRRGLLARKRWPLLLLASAIVVAGHLAMFVVAARAAGSHAPFLRLLPLMMLALFAMTLPVNIGGWGPREGVTAWAFGAAGLGATQGLTIAVLYGLFAFIAALPGVVVIVNQWVARVAAARATHARRTDATADAAADAAPIAATDTAPDTAPGAPIDTAIGAAIEAAGHAESAIAEPASVVLDPSKQTLRTVPLVDVCTVGAPVMPTAATSAAPVAIAPAPVAPGLLAPAPVAPGLLAPASIEPGHVATVPIASVVPAVVVPAVVVGPAVVLAEMPASHRRPAPSAIAEPALAV